MQRIAYLCGSGSWGGLEMNQWRNARWMRDRGHQVVIFGSDNSELKRYCEADQLDFAAMPPHRKYFDLKFGKRLNRLLETWKVQHLVIRDPRDMDVSAIAKSLGRHAFQLHYFMEMQLGVKKLNPLQTIRFRKLDTWSCPLLWLERQVKTMTHMPHDRICHIPSGLELAPLQQVLSQHESRRLLDLPETGTLIGLAGRFDPQKGQLLLLEALKQVPDKQVGIVLLGAPTHGEGESYHRAMLEFIERNGLSERVHVRPFRKDIHVFYKAIDVSVMASRAETFGMVTIESMACGTPAIGSNAGGTPELLQFGEAGYLFEPLNAEDLAKRINEFLEDPARFSKEKLQAAVEIFDHERVCALVERRLNLTPENQRQRE